MISPAAWAPPVGRGVYDSSTMAMRQRLPVRRGRRSLLATVDYSLAKRALINQVRTGLASWTDICDAHPELMRAAQHVGEPTRRDCPVCHEACPAEVWRVDGEFGRPAMVLLNRA